MEPVNPMMNAAWLHLLVGPTLVGCLMTALSACPFTLWEAQQWRIAYLGKPLPRAVTARILAPGFFALLLFLACSAIFGATMTRLYPSRQDPLGLLYFFFPIVAMVVFAIAIKVTHRLLNNPFLLPRGGTYTAPNLSPWATAAYDLLIGHNH